MKTWISFLLPADEYKEKRFLYFISEGAIIQILSLITMLVFNEYLNLSVNIVLLLSIAIFLFYVSLRYVLSGIEYTDITTETAYKKEVKVILSRTSVFIIIYMLSYIFLIGVPKGSNEWFDFWGLLLGISIVMFLSSFISLKRSYEKNKELL